MYYEQNGYPFKCSYQRFEANEISESKYKELVYKVNSESKDQETEIEKSLIPAQEYENKIQAELRAIAEERIATKEKLK